MMKKILWALAIVALVMAGCRQPVVEEEDEWESGEDVVLPPSTIDPDGVILLAKDGVTFTMGSPVGEAGRKDEEVEHQVTLSPFYMDVYPVTQANYQALIGKNPSYFWQKPDASDRPVEQVTWLEAVAYANALSVKDGYTPAYTINGSNVTWDKNANGWRLPTEAEREYAARGGTTTAFYTGNDITAADANFPGTKRETTVVNAYPANGYGLYDMQGNVTEWCWDWRAPYDTNNLTNPSGPATGSRKVARGGNWQYTENGTKSFVRSASRDYGDLNVNWRKNDVGFRLARNA